MRAGRVADAGGREVGGRVTSAQVAAEGELRVAVHEGELDDGFGPGIRRPNASTDASSAAFTSIMDAAVP